MQEKDFLMDEEKKLFERFSLALDSGIVNKHHGLLKELKVSISLELLLHVILPWLLLFNPLIASIWRTGYKFLSKWRPYPGNRLVYN